MLRSEGFILPIMLILILILSLLSLSLFQVETKHLAIATMIQHETQEKLELPSKPDASFSLRTTDPDHGNQYWQKEINHFQVTLYCNANQSQCEISSLHRVL